MEINTLQDYLLTTEIHSYLVAVGSVIAFAFFWRALNKKPDRRENKQSANQFEER